MEALSVDQLVDGVLGNMNTDLGEELSGDCLLVSSQLYPPLDDEFRVVLEEMTRPESQKKSHLVVVVQTRGGIMETVERLVSVMRHHYKKVSFIIPNYAYSAGTVLVMSGDEIYMDYYSVLGPIDPQYRNHDGKVLPGIGYLSKFNTLINQINGADPDGPNDAKAELAFLVKNFDPAELFRIEQAVKHGETLITEWLSKYKFRDWKKTDDSKKMLPAKCVVKERKR